MRYNKKDIANALKDIDIKDGDILFSHSSLGFFGLPEGGLNKDNIFSIFYDAIFEVIGDEGLLVTPTFTYSFNSLNNNGIFNYENSESKMGFFPELLRQRDDSIRTFDPMFSCALNGNSKKLLPQNIITSESFGDGSVWDLLLKNNAKLCNFNLDVGFSTFLHYCEKICNVPYRKNIKFSGTSIINGRKIAHSVDYFCRENTSIYEAETVEYSDYVRKKKKANHARVARGEIVSMDIKDSLELFKEMYNDNNYFFTVEKKKIDD